MSSVKANTESMRSQAERIKSYRTARMQTMQKMRKLILSLNDIWKGEAQDAFVQNFLAKESEFKKFDQIMEEYAKLLLKAAEQFESVDSQMSIQIKKV